MRNILCFGDSNTWGYVPGTAGDRFPLEVRIPGVLQASLGPGYRILEEGLNGRMSVWDDPMSPDRNADRNAKSQLPFLLESHKPLDLVSIMLGTNDLKAYMNLGPHAIAQAQGVLIDLVDAAKCGPGGSRPAILLIAPPLVVESPTPFGHIFDGAIPKSLAMADAYREVAREKNCLFLDAGSLVRTSVRDGIHLDPESHRELAEAMASVLKRAFA
jgi:lysophospholipase L1-like esterase